MDILRVRKLKKVFSKHKVVALDSVDLSVSKGEIFGLVGESGCGKSTLAKSILRLIDVQEGNIFYKGEDLLRASRKNMLKIRKNLQMVFQDPYMSLDPRMKIGDTLEEVFIIHENMTRRERKVRAIRLLEMVGLKEFYFDRLPSELSGGERQRVGIARSLATSPEFIICDEPVSSIDISIQAQILNLLMDLQREKNLTYLFISHDLGVIASICDRVAVMRSGRIVEQGPCEEVFKNPRHEYTKKLLNEHITYATDKERKL